MSKTIALVGTFDTKSREFLYIKDLIEKTGLNTFTIHTGIFESEFEPDVNNQDIANAIGEDIKKIAQQSDRSLGTKVLGKGIAKLLPQLYEENKFDGVLSLGGSGGTFLATAGMKELPIGVPKLMVSTMASGDVSQYVGASDIMMMPSIVDVEGLNEISRQIFSNAVASMCGMMNYEYDQIEDDKPLIAASMFGQTTPAIKHASKYLEDRGYEVIVFHATGTGGKTMERLIEDGYFDGVLDLTTTELADELVGGVLTAGPYRLEAGVQTQTPQVIAPGALDMVNFSGPESVPSSFSDRLFYQHNPSVTLMRTTPEENKKLAEIFNKKLENGNNSTIVMLPLKGFSGIDIEGGEFYDQEANRAFISTIKNNLKDTSIEVIEEEYHINEQDFAELAAQKLIDLIEKE